MYSSTRIMMTVHLFYMNVMLITYLTTCILGTSELFVVYRKISNHLGLLTKNSFL